MQVHSSGLHQWGSIIRCQVGISTSKEWRTRGSWRPVSIIFSGMMTFRPLSSPFHDHLFAWLSSENIPDTYLHCRVATKGPNNLDGYWIGSELNQNRGRIRTIPGRVVAFSNCIQVSQLHSPLSGLLLFQHRVANFSSQDPNIPGRRRVLVFSLVDPSQPVLSTLHVAPRMRFLRLEVGILHFTDLTYLSLRMVLPSLLSSCTNSSRSSRFVLC